MRNLTPSTLRIGHRYRPSRLNGPYDALVIGSGIGGLTTAALLAELGYSDDDVRTLAANGIVAR